jgi:hypothetical protein
MDRGRLSDRLNGNANRMRLPTQPTPVLCSTPLFPQENSQLFNPFRIKASRKTCRWPLPVIAALLLASGGTSQVVQAAPTHVNSPAASTMQNVDWMSAEMAQTLDLGFSVLVPTYIPEPFSSSPSISASGGYYSLYWVINGGPPTFLSIEGTVGGSLPAGSPADLNNQLFINASVQGYDAIHDVTAIYDAVWWIAGGVLYEVNAQNISVDSLSLANSLVTLVPPAPAPEPTSEPVEETVTPAPVEAPDSGAVETPDAGGTETQEPGVAPAAEVTPTAEPSATVASEIGAISAPATVTAGDSVTVTIEGAEAADLLVSDGAFAESGDAGIVDVQDGPIVWQAPLVETETTVTMSLLESATGEGIDSITITIVPREPGTPFRGSDGTDGPPHPMIGGDGTGGTQDVTLPRKSSTPTP